METRYVVKGFQSLFGCIKDNVQMDD